MPILADDKEPKKRLTAWWVLALALVPLLPVALFGCSWYQPVTLGVGSNKLLLKRFAVGEWGPRPLPRRWHAIELPAGAGTYWICWGPYD